MNIIETYKKALQYLRDLELLNSNLDSMINAEDNQKFEKILRNVMQNLSVIALCAEYYDNSDYTEQYLIVETGPQFVDFPEIDAKIAYDFAFTKGHKLTSCASYFILKNKPYIPADRAISIIEQDLSDLEKSFRKGA